MNKLQRMHNRGWGRASAYGCLALSMSLVGSYVALSKPLVAVFPVFLLAWLRFAIGAAAMPHWLRKPADEPAWSPKTRYLVFLESFLGNFMFSVCMLLGMQLSGAVAAGVVMASIPAACAVMSWLFLRERVAPQVWCGVVCAVAGIALVTLAKQAPTVDLASTQPVQLLELLRQWGITVSATALGTALLLCAVLCEAAYAVIGKKLTEQVGPKRITALINLWGLALMTPLGLWAAWQFPFAQVGAGIWVLLLFYGLAASVGTVWLWMTGLKTVSAAQAGVFTVMLPISAAAVGVVFLGEQVGGLQWLAFGVALGGVLLATWPTSAKDD